MCGTTEDTPAGCSKGDLLTRPTLARRDVPLARARAFQSSSPLGKGVARLPFTARIERAPFHRARSASKKGTWPLPSGLSEAARCASTEDHQAPSPPLLREQSKLLTPLRLTSSRGIRRHEHYYFETLACVILHAMLFPGRRHGPLPWTKHLFL